jgi:tRNA(Phe) wybutosine-synthesizing methylase Tyw3
LKAAKYKEMAYLRLEPCIMHVCCRTLKDANALTQIARHSGWKKTGIISTNKNIVEMLSTENVASPVMNKGKIITENNYLKILTNECNKKLALTRAKIKQLEKSLK